VRSLLEFGVSPLDLEEEEEE